MVGCELNYLARCCSSPAARVTAGPTPRTAACFRRQFVARPAGSCRVAVGQGYAKVTADLGKVRAAIIENLREPGRMAALRTIIGLSKADTTALLPRSRVPALVVMGSRDPDFPDAEAESQWLATQLHGDSLMIDGAGHYPHTEMPERIAPELLSFVARAHG